MPLEIDGGLPCLRGVRESARLLFRATASIWLGEVFEGVVLKWFDTALGFQTRVTKLSKVRQAIGNYPFYDRPHKQAPKQEFQAGENFTYFDSARQYRLEFFQDWLRRYFDLNASFDAVGAHTVSQWADRYGEGLLGDNDHNEFFFPHYSRSWTQENSGYNVIFDLGIFIGEFVIAKRSQCRWALMQETPDKPWIKRSVSKLHPSIYYASGADGMAPFNVAWGVLSDRHRGIPALNGLKARKGALVRSIKQFLYIARLSQEKDIIFSVDDIDRENLDVVL